MVDLEELIASVDIVEYIGQFAELEQRGREYWCLSPLKSEDTPSFSISPDKQCFCDFSSGNSGGIIQFIEAYFHCTTYQAIKKLEEYAGVKGVVFDPKRFEAIRAFKKYRVKRHDFKHNSNTKVMSERIMDKYIINSNELQVWIDEGISEDILREFGVRYDAITNRIVYPIRNLQGEIVNVGARTLDPNYKAKGIRKYSYLQGWNGGMDVIYGLYEAIQAVKRSGYLILFEGVKSVLKAASWGVRNTSAILTSHLNPNQIRILLSTCCLNNVAVIFALDKDVNIADDKNIKKLTRYMNVYYLQDTEGLLDEKDSPVDKGFEVFKTLCRNKKRLR